MKKEHNMNAVRNELLQRNILLNEQTDWTSLLKSLNENKGEETYFTPLTNYDAFKWNSIHFDLL